MGQPQKTVQPQRIMDTTFKPGEWEAKIYAFWEKKGYLDPASVNPQIGKETAPERFTVLMPPPNANASLHAGHGMYSVDDVVVRWKRLQGIASEWLPGMDHAGFETQFVYEKQLRKEGKSRMDFDRKTLYDNIRTFVENNSGQIYEQLRRLGFLANWKRSVFTLDDHVVAYVHETFQKMAQDGLVYRDEYIVNYCTHCGTSLADLEVKYEERADNLYYIRYELEKLEKLEKLDFLEVATVRTELIPIDTHLAVHPDNPKTKQLIGKKARNPITGAIMDIIADVFVDPEFGTGVVKLTPGHDPNDFVAARSHGLPIVKGIDLRGRMIGGPYDGMKVAEAREASAKALQESGAIARVDEKYEHSVQTCYKCGRTLEPLTMPNWFVRVDELKSRVEDVVQNDAVAFHPKKFKKQMLDWLNVMHDWPISRQLVWGIRVPVWYEVGDGTSLHAAWIDAEGKTHHGTVAQHLQEGAGLHEIREGLQTLSAGPEAKYIISDTDPTDGEWLPETDTFDTWFSSGQWPLVTTQPDELPTQFIGTLSDILKFWISRMIMFTLYRTDKVPFTDVYLWSMVADKQGLKMSKSKGNVLNPIELVDAYGADAFRASLFFGVSQGGKVILAHEKVMAMRNFANKLWNIGRFIQMCRADENGSSEKDKNVQALVDEHTAFHAKAFKDMEAFHFSRAFDDMYEFVWHRLADHHLELLKESMRSGNIGVLDAVERVYAECLKIAHPFMPFVTEAIWKSLYGEERSILDSRISQTIHKNTITHP